MARNTRFKRFADSNKLTARTIAPIRAGVKEVELRLETDDRFRLRGRKFSLEAFIQCAVWHLIEMKQADQERVLLHYLARLNAYLEEHDVETKTPPAAEPSEGRQKPVIGFNAVGLTVVNEPPLGGIKASRHNKRTNTPRKPR